MAGSTGLWPSLLATWLNLAPVPSAAPPPTATAEPQPSLALPAKRD